MIFFFIFKNLNTNGGREMRTVLYGDELTYAYHKVIDGRRVAINVDEDGEEINVVFPQDEVSKELDYYDWLELDYYEPKEEENECS